MQVLSGSCRGGLGWAGMGHIGVGMLCMVGDHECMEWVMQGGVGSCRGGMNHVGLGWVM